jgi:hypothetical protein
MLGPNGALLAVLTVAAVKFLGIGMNFMELRHSHVFWRALLSSILVGVLGVCYGVLRGMHG